MKSIKVILSLISLFVVMVAKAQITGCVIDGETGDSIAYASVMYRGHDISTISNKSGVFSIARHEGWNITFSAVGYKPRMMAVTGKTKSDITITLTPDSHRLGEVTIKAKRKRYSRKNNPAVELMKKVVAAKKLSDLANHDYYQYTKYQKLTLAANDLTPSQMEKKPFSNHSWLVSQVEACPYNNKLILPISVQETVSQKVYRKKPHDEKTIIRGEKNSGINDLIQTGDILNTVMRDVFTDVNIYDDQVRLLQYPFTSPIGKDAINFYRYYIEDTVMVNNDLCYHLSFTPNNQQDFGFRGELYILADSSYHVRRCELSIPRRSDVNFVENLQVTQEYTRLPNGEWVLTTDDMITELKFVKFLQKFIAIRTTRLSEYGFEELPKGIFRGKAPEVKEADAEMRNDEFWNQYRQVQLTKSETQMNSFIKNIMNIKGFKYIMLGVKALVENFVETGNPSKVDFGPVNTLVSRNFIDGLRTRVSGLTTANLNKHWFLSGYYAHGWESHKNYYSGELTYSLNAKEYLPREFPKRTLSLQSSYDVMSPSDQFVNTDKDNVFTAFKWAKVDKMLFSNRQQLTFEYEQDWGIKTTLNFKCEENEACGAMSFHHLNESPVSYSEPVGHGEFMRTTQLRGEIRFAPGETFINTKQRRIAVNRDAPVFTLSHTIGFKDVLGGNYNYNLSEISFFKRFWMKSWGRFDVNLKAGAQWNKVPYPLLCMPAANLSYILHKNVFGLVNNMEFLNDRYASMMLLWDFNGKILNRIPLIKKLKWREAVGFNMLWGKLTDKNNPFLVQNAGDKTLMYFPEGCNVMNPDKPYSELVVGLHNIFKILQVQYFRRLTYLDLPTAHKQGVRFIFMMTF